MSATLSDKASVYVLTRLAQADLENVWRYTAETWSVKQADRYISDLADIFALIASMPQMARERKEFNPPVRIHVHENHVIVYLADDSGVEILRVLGGQQDWVSILRNAEP